MLSAPTGILRGVERNEYTGRVISKPTDLQLEAAVRAIAMHVARDVPEGEPPGDPVRTSRPDFDKGRGPAGWGSGVPTAASISRRWKTPWAEILITIFDEKNSLQHRVASRSRNAPIAAPSLEEVSAALKLIAGRLGVDTLRPGQYETECGVLRAQIGSKWLHGKKGVHLLPTVDQIDQNYGWDAALQAAGLRERAANANTAGTSVAVALELFMLEVGCVPWSRTVLRQFMKDRDLSLAVSQTQKQDLVDFQTARVHAGLPIAPKATPERKREPLPPAPATLPNIAGLVPNRPKLSPAELVAGIRRAQDRAHRDNVAFTQRRWRTYAKEDRRIPYPTVAQRYAEKNNTTVADLRRQAADLPK